MSHQTDILFVGSGGVQHTYFIRFLRNNNFREKYLAEAPASHAHVAAPGDR